MADKRRQYFAGMILVFAVVIGLITVFFMLGRTNKYSQYLMDTGSTRYGWSYTILTDGKAAEVEPEFQDEYTMVLPGGESAEAVKITRTLTETLPEAGIGWRCYGSAVEVFMDGVLIYSDFQTTRRDAAGFLMLDQQDIEHIAEEKTVQISLPLDYTGAELTMITYFARGMEGSSPVYPFLENFETSYAGYVVDSVLPVALMTLYGILTVLIVVIFVLDIANGTADFRILLLGLSFVFLLLGTAYNSLPGSVSILSEHMNLSFLSELYIAPLYLYLVLYLTGWKKHLMSGGVILWFLYEGTMMLRNVSQGELFRVGRRGRGALLLLSAVAAAFLLEYVCGRRKKEGKKGAFPVNLFYGGLAVVIVVLRVLYGAREWNGDAGMYLYQMISSAVYGNCFVVVHLIADISAAMAVILLVLEFIRRTIRTKEMIGILEERSRLTLEGYNRVLKAEEATNSARHEMLHHMTALMGILNNGETERACTYIASVTDEINHLPAVRYSQNILVNVIAGTYLDKAKDQGIQVEYSLPIPAKLDIADEDLSVFLTNMLQNAVQACERMDPEQERYINIKMYLNENFLFIGCVNSRSEEGQSPEDSETGTEEERLRHGFGLEAMSRIAEKYGSILKIDKSPREFSVKSNLCLKWQTR